MNDLNLSVDRTTANRQVSEATISKEVNLTPGDRVYLYDDPTYTGTLIRPIEKTYPARWAVELDSGHYEAVKVSDFSLVTEEIPFTDNESEARIKQLEEEIIALRRENLELKQKNQKLEEELKEAKQTIRYAKNISPLMRISLKRVLRLAADACMDVKRTAGGWILKMGNKARKFRRLADIWDLLSQDDWQLSEIFPEDKLVPINKILPPRRRQRPTPPNIQPTPFISRNIVRSWKEIGLAGC